MTDGHCFISYSAADGLDFATKLADELQGRHPNIHVWFDKREMDASIVDWDDQLANAIKGCKCLVFVMTPDSTIKGSTCKEEWTWALKYKKPVICLLKDKKAEVPFRLNNRQYIDISTDFDSGIALLRSAIKRLDEPEGILEELDRRLSQAKRDFQRTPREEEKPRIQAEIEDLTKQIEAQQKIVANPKAAEEQTQKNIEAGLERERKPEKPTAAQTSTKFINQPPSEEQKYFRDRQMETEQVILFLKNDAQRLMTVVGRGGAGKSAMTCRLLKHIENGTLPDDFERKHGKISVDGIVYLSETGSRKINFANLFADLCRLLPNDVSAKLDALYKNPQTSTDEKTHQLLEELPAGGQIILLLDNFENVVDLETQNIKDAELEEALKAILHAPHHSLKVIVTTRLAPEEFGLYEPARQRLLPLDSGLAAEYAKEALLLMDDNNLVGIKNAGDELLNLAVTRTLGLPRALEALYAALRSDRYTKLEELLALPILPENVVEAYVGEAFNRLDTNAQKVMQALAVYNRPVTPAAVDYLLAPHIPAIDSAPILQRLANMHFARKESGRFYLHPVDREFAYNLLPEGSPDDTFIEKGGIQLFNNLWGLLEKYPDLLQNQDTFNQAVQNENANIVIGSVMAFQYLDASLVEKMQQEGIFEDENFLTELDKSFHIPPIWTRYALTNRAADYFAQARKPRAEWKKLDDLAAQLAEFDLRCAAGDYDTAASVLDDIDFDYLFVWGHYRLIIDLHERLQGKIIDKELARRNIGNLGQALSATGKDIQAIPNYEKALAMAQEAKNRQAEGAWLGNLGLAYANLGDSYKAIEYYEQQLKIAQEIDDRQQQGNGRSNIGNTYANLGNTRKAIESYEQAMTIYSEIGDHGGEGAILGNLGILRNQLGESQRAIEFFEQALVIIQKTGNKEYEALSLENIGHSLLSRTEYRKAKENYQQAIQIADEISLPMVQLSARWGLAQAYLYQNDLVNARTTIEAALQYDMPENNHNVSALHGIIALRQGETETAQEAFTKSIAQADEILAKTPDYYDALDAKGLAVAGLLVIGNWRLDGERDKLHAEAIEIFKRARGLRHMRGWLSPC